MGVKKQFGEQMKDVGRRIIGQGLEVDYKNAVKNLEQTQGISTAEAEKIILTNIISDAGRESLSPDVDPDAEEFRRFEGAISEIFDSNQIEAFKQAARTAPMTRPNFALSPSPLLTNIGHHYQGKYNGKMPPQSVIRDSAESLHVMERLLTAVSRNSGMSGNIDIRQVVAADPNLQWQIGRIFLERGQMDTHEDRFDTDLRFNESIANLKTTASRSIGDIFGRNLNSFMKASGQFIRKPSFDSGMRTAFHGAKYGVTALSAGAKLLWKTAGAGWRGANYLRAQMN